MVNSLQDFQVQNNKPPQLDKFIIHPAAIFIGNYHRYFLLLSHHSPL
jgi:hypothetical protein